MLDNSKTTKTWFPSLDIGPLKMLRKSEIIHYPLLACSKEFEYFCTFLIISVPCKDV